MGVRISSKPAKGGIKSHREGKLEGHIIQAGKLRKDTIIFKESKQSERSGENQAQNYYIP